ncbi:MAG: glutathione S-transferase N-terminal domain-containing protein [Pseudomonadota bacterium]
MTGYTLFGSEMSYFSGKARAYLRWKGISFTEIAPTPQVMKDEIIANIGWPVIPVLKTPKGEYVQDTADIIAHFENLSGGQKALPATPLQLLVTFLLQLFADEWMTLPAMHYRWNKNEEWIYGEFGKSAAPDGTLEQQYEAGKAVGQRFRSFVPMLGITPETAPGVEKAYEQFLADLSKHLESLPYLLGTRASYADFALIGPLYAHQYRDKHTGEHMKRTAPKVADYVERVIAGHGKTGDLIPNDDIPRTLLPILKVALDEHVPVLAATIERFSEWAMTAEPRAEVPRGLGMVPFATGGHGGMIAARTFSLLRLQDALDAYQLMMPSDKKRADAMLSSLKAESFKSLRIDPRLTRRNYRLALA